MSGVDCRRSTPGLLWRAWAFMLELWDVLIRPSSVFGLGVLVLAGFVAGVIFWGGFNTALEVDQHREILHQLSRDARQRVRRAEIDHPFHQPLGRARELPGLPRAAQLDRQDRAQDAGLQGGLGQIVRLPSIPAKNSSTSGSSWRCTNGRASRPTNPWNAATATARTPWTSPSSRRAPPWLTSASSSPARRPASIATRASRIICPTCAAFPAGSDGVNVSVGASRLRRSIRSAFGPSKAICFGGSLDDNRNNS